MQIITYTCPDCGTVVAANELETNRVMKCPERNCDAVLRFDDLPVESCEFFLSNRERYQL
jgi:uncharacterized paraquat-inducible protein A